MQEGDYSLQSIRVKYNIVAMNGYVSLNTLCDRCFLSKPKGFGKMPTDRITPLTDRQVCFCEASNHVINPEHPLFSLLGPNSVGDRPAFGMCRRNDQR